MQATRMVKVQAMETKIRQDTVECRTRGHIPPLALESHSIRPYHIRCRNRRRGCHGHAPFRTLLQSHWRLLVGRACERYVHRCEKGTTEQKNCKTWELILRGERNAWKTGNRDAQRSSRFVAAAGEGRPAAHPSVPSDRCTSTFQNCWDLRGGAWAGPS